ncbi:hypothetical protein Tco_0523875 [Tanacetum coccineum]
MHHSKQQNHHFLMVMLRLEFHIASVLAVEKLTLGFLPDILLVFLVSSIVLAFMKDLIYRVLGLQVPLLELNRFRILLGEWEEGQVSIVMGGIFRIEARDMDMKLLSAPESNNTLARYYFQWLALGYAVLGQMAHLVASITLDSASISSDSFLPSILLWLVIIVAVVGVGVTVVVVIIVVVVVVVESPSVVKLSFVIT